MTYTSYQERGTKSGKSSLLTFLMVMLVGLFTVGCGDSGEDFVVTGTNNNPTPTGNVTFQFQRAQSNIAQVPATTSSLLFNFFNAANQNVGAVEVAYADTVTLAVPVGATRAVVTAKDANGNTVGTVSFTFTVVQGGSTTATVSGGGTTGGTTGNTTGGTTGNTTGGTTGNTTGGTTGNTTGDTTGNTTGDTTGDTTGGTPARLVLFQENLFIAPAGASLPLAGTFFPANSTVGTAVGGAIPNSFTAVPVSTSPAGTEGNWSYLAAGNVVQAFNLGNQPGDNNTITYRIIYTAPNGESAEDTVTVTATTNPALLTTVQSARIVTVNGDSLKLTAGSSYPIQVAEVLGNGAVNFVNPETTNGGTPTAGQYQVTSSSAAVTYAAGSGILNFAGVGTSTITVTRNNAAPANGVGGTIGTLNATVVDTSLLATVPANQNAVLTLTGANAGAVNAVIPYKAELVFTDGTRQDITPVAGVTPVGALTVNTLSGFNSGSVTINAVGPASLALSGTLIGGAIIPTYSANLTPVAITGNP